MHLASWWGEGRGGRGRLLCCCERNSIRRETGGVEASFARQENSHDGRCVGRRYAIAYSTSCTRIPPFYLTCITVTAPHTKIDHHQVYRAAGQTPLHRCLVPGQLHTHLQTSLATYAICCCLVRLSHYAYSYSFPPTAVQERNTCVCVQIFFIGSETWLETIRPCTCSCSMQNIVQC